MKCKGSAAYSVNDSPQARSASKGCTPSPHPSPSTPAFAEEISAQPQIGPDAPLRSFFTEMRDWGRDTVCALEGLRKGDRCINSYDTKPKKGGTLARWPRTLRAGGGRLYSVHRAVPFTSAKGGGGGGVGKMSVRPNSIPLQFLPDEARSLPPPKLTDPRVLYSGFMGYCAALLDNLLHRRPVVSAGVHRQLLYVTSFYFVGYYLIKRQDFKYAQRDRDMFKYMELHPEDFIEKEKKTYAEIFEEFYPVR
ncbi:NADH dehydrogenase [ubiquinone] 1 subunit C2 [Dromiciops gliroides]|uniref:NADH dehydrogenase [ubiquinone] 1 subunit C2 n=1 Tax=Dromiciops gliroides TaxID=33562 RepID=UPI001CC65BF7|nr:NADH dehydrogenase [ubiquinone] 1 subunit C2 [Dromiciops gliroides]